MVDDKLIEQSVQAKPRNQDGFSLLILAFTSAWILFVTLSFGYGSWLGGEFAFIKSGEYPPGFVWLILAIVLAFLLLLPLAALGILWKVPRYRAVFQTWAIAAGYIALLAPAQLPAYTAEQTTRVLRIVLNLVFLMLLLGLAAIKRRRNPHRTFSQRANFRSIWPALLFAPLIISGWLLWGAAGSALDVLLGLAEGMLFGLAVGLLLGQFFLPTLGQTSNGSSWDITLGGFVSGTVLLMMSTGISLRGIQVQLMWALPALGWLLIALSLWGAMHAPERNWPGVATLVGLSTVAAFIFVDPDELTLVLNLLTRDALFWANRAAWLSAASAWLIGIILFLLRNRIPNWEISGKVKLGTVGVWLAALALFLLTGTRGLHGERLFVILADQSDLSAIAAIANYDERRTRAYVMLVNHADQSQVDMRSGLERFRIEYTPYYLMNALEVRGGPLLRLWLESRPEVDRVIASPVLRPLPAQAPAARGSALAPTRPQWNLTSIGADRVWEEFGVTGSNIVVGQSDSGVQWDHPELRSSYRGSEEDHNYHWLDPWTDEQAPIDFGGHGTLTLGSILGDNVGVAPDATWFACANLQRNLGNPALYLDCMQFMLAPYPIDGDPFTDGDALLSAHVLNNSWGCPPIEGCDAEALQPAVQALRAAGIFVVGSAGNEGPDCESLSSPLAIYDEVFSVGAIDEFDELPAFSSVGPVTTDGSQRTKPDIVAPGVDVLSTYPQSTYELASGTSMAGPHVVGVVALMWSANPNLIGNIEITEAILAETARPYNGARPLCEGASDNPSTAIGYGILDAYAAVERALRE